MASKKAISNPVFKAVQKKEKDGEIWHNVFYGSVLIGYYVKLNSGMHFMPIKGIVAQFFTKSEILSLYKLLNSIDQL